MKACLTVILLAFVLVSCDSSDPAATEEATALRDGSATSGDLEVLSAKATCPCWSDDGDIADTITADPNCSTSVAASVTLEHSPGGELFATVRCIRENGGSSPTSYVIWSASAKRCVGYFSGLDMDLASKQEAQACVGVMRSGARAYTGAP